MVWTARATDKVVIPKAEYVFVGFGIHAPEYGWDDYKDIDVKGKIVIAMVNDPGYYDATLFRGRLHPSCSHRLRRADSSARSITATIQQSRWKRLRPV